MVYDLGGGTFDVSVLEIGEGVIEVLATAGDTHLGGDDFDECIMNYLVAEFKKENGIDLSTDRVAMQRLREAAEKAKCDLSGVTSTNVNLPYITADANGPKHLDVTISRAKFNELTGHLVERTMGNLPVREKVPLEDLVEVQKLIKEVDALGSARAIVRYSGTENKMRILVEAPERETVETWIARIRDAAQKQLG